MKQKILLFSEQILLYSKFQYIEWAHLLTILYKTSRIPPRVAYLSRLVVFLLFVLSNFPPIGCAFLLFHLPHGLGIFILRGFIPLKPHFSPHPPRWMHSFNLVNIQLCLQSWDGIVWSRFSGRVPPLRLVSLSLTVPQICSSIPVAVFHNASLFCFGLWVLPLQVTLFLFFIFYKLLTWRCFYFSWVNTKEWNFWVM